MRHLMRRRTFIYLALSLMTAAWETALLRAIFGAAGPPPMVTIAVLTALVGVSLAFSRWARGLKLRRDLYRGLLAGAFAFLALLVVSSGFYNDYGLTGGGWLNRLLANELSGGTFMNQTTSLVIFAACWWLGVALGDMPLTAGNLSRYLYISLLALAAPAVFFVADISRDLPWLFYLFLFAALVALALGRVEEVARRSRSLGSPFTLFWLAHSGVAAGVVLALVGVASALGLARGFGLVLAVASMVLTAMAYPLAFIGAKTIALVLKGAPQASAPEAPDLSQAGPATTRALDPAAPQYVCVGLLTFVFFLLILVALVASTRRWRQILKDQEKEEKVALPSLGERVTEVVGERLSRLGLGLPGLGRVRRRLAARSVRRIYAALVALGAERGYPRDPARTPYEHLWALKRAFPGSEAQVTRITEAYVAVHYGEVPEDRAALREIKDAWEQVRETAQNSTPLRGQAVEEGGRV